MNKRLKTREFVVTAPRRARYRLPRSNRPEPNRRPADRRFNDGMSNGMSNGTNNDDSRGLNLVDIVRILKRHKLGLILPTLLITAAVFTLLQFISPRYTAQTRLLIGGGNPTPTEMAPVSAGLAADDETIASSEQYIFTSHDLLSEVIDELSLDEIKEFNPRLSGSDTEGKKLTEAQVRSLLVSKLADKITIANEPDSRVITIQATTNDPTISASVANTIVEKYLDQQIDMKLNTAGRVDSWLVKRVEELREDVNRADDDIKTFRQQSALLQPGASVLIAQEVSELNTQLLRARNDRITAVAQINSDTNVLESSLINSLKSAEATLKGEIAGLEGKYGALHPTMVRNQAELKRLQRELYAETKKITNNVADAVKVATERERKLEADLATVKRRLAEVKQKEISLRELEREGDASRELLATFLSRQKEVHLQNDVRIQSADARVISYAGIPHSKSFPKILPITALAFVASLFLSLMGVFVADQFNGGYKSVKQVTDATGLPILGVIPQQKNIKSIPQLVNSTRKSHLGESFRNLQVQLGLTESRNRPNKEGKTFLVTSMYPGDGKTSVVSCLAMSLRRSGDKVLLIDGDLRKPTLHKVFNINPEKGIRSAEWQNFNFSELIQSVGQEKVSNIVDIIPANSAGKIHPHDVLSSPLFTQLLQLAKRHYDIIIVDSPPLRAVDDAVVISRAVDSTLFVLPWGRGTSRKAIQSGLKQLDANSLAGIVITKMDVKVHDQLAYGDNGRYRKALIEYYRTSA